MLCHMKMDFQNIILGTYGKFVQNRAFSLICKIGHSALFWLNHFIVTDFQIQPKNRRIQSNSLCGMVWYLDTNGHFIALLMRHTS